jgi:hypothetical protein
MYKKYKILSILGIIVVFLSPQIIVIAQDNNVDTSTEVSGLDPAGLKSGEITDCFDTYKFGSIGLTAGTIENIYRPYDAVEIAGEIVNQNRYPITDVSLRARVLRTHPSPVQQRALYTTVDDLVILDKFTLNSNETLPFNYLYFVPGDAPTGDYLIQYYVYNQDRFNLSGLSFTEDIIANLAEFTVEGGSEHVYLDKTNIIVGGQENDTRAFITTHEIGRDITVKIPLVNPTEIAKNMEVSYKLYRWDGIVKENIISEEIREIVIEPNTSLEQEYIVINPEDPIYYLEITSKLFDNGGNSTKQEKTMAHIRFMVPYNNRPRVNWVGLDNNPFEGGDLNLLTCVHNTVSTTDKGPIRVESIARDEKGRELSRIEYEGRMPSAISGIKNKLNTDRRFNLVTIETNLYNSNNELIDNIITKYDCNEISPELCIVGSNKNRLNIRNVLIIISILVLSILGTGIWYKNIKK